MKKGDRVHVVDDRLVHIVFNVPKNSGHRDYRDVFCTTETEFWVTCTPAGKMAATCLICVARASW